MSLPDMQLDRAGDMRADAGWVAAKRAEGAACVLPMWKLQPFLRHAEDGGTELVFLDGTVAEGLGEAAREVFLGLKNGSAYFARDISELADGPARLAGLGQFQEAREALGLVSAGEAAILCQAKALLDWHARHGFCSNCGVASESADGGYRRHCRACGADHFPRTDPAAIMLVTRRDRCLLARNKRFAGSSIHSALAGFVEPGESVEEAVRREVREEVGIRTGAVRYFASQPWPFPASLMIGCFAKADTDEIRIDGTEIVAARWFEREDVLRMVAGEGPANVALPRRHAIAFRLIESWARERA